MQMPPLLIFLIALFLLLPGKPASAVTDLYLSTGTASATYTETTDSQSKELSGTEQSLSWRRLNAVSFVDFGVDVGKLTLSGDTGTHDVDFSSDYLNLIAGISFSLYPSWIDYAIDYGLRLSVDRMTISRDIVSGGVETIKIGALGEESISRFAARAYFSEALFIGMSVEQKSGLFQKSEGDLKPKLESGKSSTFSIGYRFGGKAKGSKQTKGSKKIDPPGFGVCPPEWNAGC
jgi:hypothetical protein